MNYLLWLSEMILYLQMDVHLYIQWAAELSYMRFRVKCSFTTRYSFHYEEKKSPRNDESLLNRHCLAKKFYS